MRFAAAALALVLAGCSVESVDYAGRECPCIGGWVCDEARNLCVRADAADAGEEVVDAWRADGATPPADAGVDATAPDAGPPRDAGLDAQTTMIDAGMDSGPPDDPATHCDDIHAGALFCEDFEGDVGPFTERHVSTGASASVSGSETYMGTGALRCETPMGELEAYRRADVLPEISTGDLYVRWWYYFETGYTIDAIEVAALAESMRAFHLVATNYGGSSDIHTHDFSSDARVSGATGISQGAWTCVEIHVGFDDATGEIELFVDGTLVAAIRDFDTVQPGGLTNVEAGLIWQSAAQTPAVLYVDEIVAATSPIGCDD